MDWETVIGLEVHAELSTKSKMFCGCRAAFGGAPNTQCCPVCMGMPGALPVLNEKVVEYAMRAGIALNCDITRYTKFDRKNYFYPDLPKAYQISQLYLPICRSGRMIIETSRGEKDIRIHEIHMEEDAGKLIHDPRRGTTRADYNRCGVPLIEIVSGPDFRSGEEVIAYLEKLKSTLAYLGISDCKMQEGSMRADINLSVRRAGAAALGVRTEIKNISSFKAIAKAVDHEAKRQVALLTAGNPVLQETRRWDEGRDRSFAMRTKENVRDYRFFPEPDLPPVEISDAWYEAVKNDLPEMAWEKKRRYMEEYGLPQYDAGMLTEEKALADFFEGTVALGCAPKEVSNWMLGDLFRLLKDRSVEVKKMRMTPQKLAGIIKLIDDGTLNRVKGKEVLEAVFDGGDADMYVAEHGLAQISDAVVIASAVNRVLAENQRIAEEYRDGKAKVFSFLMGEAMRALGGRADPAAVRQALREKLEE